MKEKQAGRRRSRRRRSDISAAQVLERITDEFSALDFEWRFTYVNDAALNALRRAQGEGLTREEVLGKNVWEMFPAYVGSVLYHKYHEAMREQKTVEFEARSAVTARWIGGRLYPSDKGLSVYTRDITERKQVEARLANDAYVLDHIHDAVIATDERLAITTWNKGAEQMYGWAAAEARGKHIWDLVPVDLSEQQRAEHLRNLEERSPLRVEAVTYRKDGTPVHVEGTTIVLRKEGAKDQIAGYVNIRRDITERKHAEEALRTSNRRIQNILESITEGFVALDHEWRFTYINQRALARIRSAKGEELAREDLLGRKFWEVFPQIVRTSIYRKYYEALRERKTVSYDTYFSPTDSWFEVHLYPSEDGLSVYSLDVTERKRAEQQRRRSEAYLATAEKLSHTGSWAWNVVTGDLFWSEEHFRICGLDPERQKPTMQCIHPDDRAMVRATLETAIRDRSDFELDCRVVWTDGTIRYVRSLARPVSSESGELNEYVGTIIDVTEKRDADELRNELVRRRFASQEDERRRISRELHDEFGQQLAALNLNLAALKRDLGGHARIDRRLALAEAIVAQLGSNVAHLAGELRPSALDDLGLAAALTQYANSWSKHFDIHAELHIIDMESSRLTDELDIAFYRILQESLTNVAKHARARTVNIFVQRQSGHVSLMVEDDGVGFDTTRPSDAHKKLGIVGMRERATLLGGTLHVESEMGRGTLVVARLPGPVVPDSTDLR